MKRPETVLGLALELLRVRGLTRHATIGALALSTGALALASAGLSTRDERVVAARAQAVAEWQHAPSSEIRVAFVSPSLLATRTGWLLAWTRWDQTATTQLAALNRDGTLRGAPVTLTAPDVFARFPLLARGPSGNAIVWGASEGRQLPHVWFAVVDDDAKIQVAPRPISGDDDYVFRPQIAYGGDGWAIGWPRFDRVQGYTLARLNPDGTPRGERTHVNDPHAGFEATLTWTGNAWLTAQTAYVRERDESALRLRWFNRDGQPFANTSFALARGTPGRLNATARGATTWLTWGDDMSFSPRHDPRMARVEDRAVTAGPARLGPRRSGSVPSIACAGDGCTLAWAEIVDSRHAIAAYYTQRVSPEGSTLGAPRVIPAPELARVWSDAAIAHSLDERESLAVFTGFRRDRGGLYVVRLNSDGAPLAPGQELSLP